MITYQKEEGEQEYYMYYDLDVPKMIDNQVQHYANKVEELLKKMQKDCLELTDTSSEKLREAGVKARKALAALPKLPVKNLII